MRADGRLNLNAICSFWGPLSGPLPATTTCSSPGRTSKPLGTAYSKCGTSHRPGSFSTSLSRSSVLKLPRPEVCRGGHQGGQGGRGSGAVTGLSTGGARAWNPGARQLLASLHPAGAQMRHSRGAAWPPSEPRSKRSAVCSVTRHGRGLCRAVRFVRYVLRRSRGVNHAG